MTQVMLVTVGTVLLGIGTPWLLAVGAEDASVRGGLGAGMSLFPIVLLGLGAGLIGTGLGHRRMGGR